jgi:hypothetical protein
LVDEVLPDLGVGDVLVEVVLVGVGHVGKVVALGCFLLLVCLDYNV